jgi:abhydrolase domain-containing protein 12
VGKTHNIKLTTTDNVTLGAWFTFSDPFYDSLSSPPTLPHHLSTVLRSRPTILFLHGNAANRAFRLRLHLYTAYSSHLATNVLAIDYRGFGDSAGTPSEAGLTRDARAAWDWLLAAGAAPGDVLVVGHSLGAAVAVGLTSQLAEEGVRCRGLVAMSPFSALRTLLDTYNIFGIFPLLRPLAMVPGAPGELPMRSCLGASSA